MSSDLSAGRARTLAGLLSCPAFVLLMCGPAVAGGESLTGSTPVFTPGPVSLPGSLPVFVPPVFGSETSAAATGDLGGSSGSGAFTASTAQEVAGAVNQIMAQSLSIPPIYRVDFIAERLKQLEESLPAGAGYDEVQAVLDKAQQDLRSVVAENRDRTKPRVRVTTGGEDPSRSSRPLAPVREESVDEVLEEAAVILEDAAVLLLRSSAESQANAEHIEIVAQALDSSALLLRS